MTKKASMGKEIIINTANRAGILSEICALFIRGGIKIEGMVGVAVENDAKIMVLTKDIRRAEALLQEKEFVPIKEISDEKPKETMWDDDISRAITTLKSSGFKLAEEADVIIVELDKESETLKSVVDILAANKLDIKHIYTTACSNRCPDRLILTTDDNSKALRVLNEKPQGRAAI